MFAHKQWFSSDERHATLGAFLSFIADPARTVDVVCVTTTYGKPLRIKTYFRS